MRLFLFYLLIFTAFSLSAFAQEYRVTKEIDSSPSVAIKNRAGRVTVGIQPKDESPAEGKKANSIVVTARSEKGVTEGEVKIIEGLITTVEIVPSFANKQIDVTVLVPVRSRLAVETLAGAVDVSGNFQSVDVKTDTGTVSTDIPDDAISYDLQWTEARPRYLADFELTKIKEGAAGRFSIKGKYPDTPKDKKKDRAKKIDKEQVVATDDDPPADGAEKGEGGPTETLPRASGRAAPTRHFCKIGR